MTSKTLFSVYNYSWAIGNTTAYKIPDLKTAVQKLGLRAATQAFLISDGTPTGIFPAFTDSIPDMQQFVKSG